MAEPNTASVSARRLLALDMIDPLRFRSVINQDNHNGAIFGGQPLGQALAAAARTVEGWPAHSLSALFLRGGTVAVPVDYAVEVVRDGRRFAARRVLASQAGRPIFDMLCSFHDREDGPDHQAGRIDDVPPPEDVASLSTFAAANAHRLPATILENYAETFPIEMRLVDPEAMFFGSPGVWRRDYWFRMPSAAEVQDLGGAQSLLAYASDYMVAGVAGAINHGIADPAAPSVMTVNHALHFHAPADIADWHLYRVESPWLGRGRGLMHGAIYDRTGRLVASSVQEVRIGRG